MVEIAPLATGYPDFVRPPPQFAIAFASQAAILTENCA